MILTEEEYKTLRDIKIKMEQGKAKSSEMQDFLNLIIKNGNELEINDYIRNIGFDSLEDFKQHLNRKIENEKFVKGLAIVGGGLLLAWLLARK